MKYLFLCLAIACTCIGCSGSCDCSKDCSKEACTKDCPADCKEHCVGDKCEKP